MKTVTAYKFNNRLYETEDEVKSAIIEQRVRKLYSGGDFYEFFRLLVGDKDFREKIIAALSLGGWSND